MRKKKNNETHHIVGMEIIQEKKERYAWLYWMDDFVGSNTLKIDRWMINKYFHWIFAVELTLTSIDRGGFFLINNWLRDLLFRVLIFKIVLFIGEPL